ncbi:MAG: VWA domain-containing protein [Steroidobacteraceae bacterium]
MKRRQEFQVFSMSFLDTICCAFGAVILLFMLSKFGEPKALEQAREQLEGQIVALNQELNELKGQSVVLNRDLNAKQEQVSEEKARIARLRGDLSDIQGRYAASKQESEVANQIQGQLVAAQQQLSEEMKRLLGSNFRRRPDDETIGGIPVDSEYVIFLIDTSGSMFNYEWPQMLQKVEETLNIYPKLKGFQVMNDVGTPMFPSYAGKWIPDSPGQRKTVIDRLRTWNAFSASNPAGGIVSAIQTYWARDKKISLYVFGDEFTGSSIDSVVKTVDLVNREGQTGERLVRIHAIGFPVRPDAPQYTSIRFATLMRILCARNGGTFVGLQEPRNGRGIRIGQAEKAEEAGKSPT